MNRRANASHPEAQEKEEEEDEITSWRKRIENDRRLVLAVRIIVVTQEQGATGW